MRWLTLVMAVLLAGCASTRAVQEAKVPNYVPCVVSVPQRPTCAYGQGPYPGDAQAAKLLALCKEAYVSYASELEVALSGCLAVGSGK